MFDLSQKVAVDLLRESYQTCVRNTRLCAPVALAAAVPLLSLAGCASAPITADPVYFPPPPAQARVVHLKSFNRLNELVPARVSFTEALRGRSVSPFVNTPAGIAYRQGRLYICDTDDNVVHIWDLTTGQARRIGLGEDSALGKPVAVAVNDQGTVFVTDTGRGEVSVFDGSGVRVDRLRPPHREKYRPVSVAVWHDRLFVTDVEAHVIDVFSINDRKHVASFGGIGSKTGQFYFPMGVAVDATGRIFVSDSMNSRVQLFGPQYESILAMGRPGNRYGDMGKPRHLAVGPDGVVFVADVEFRHVHLFNTKVQLLMLLGGPQDKPGGSPMPVGIAVADELPDRIASLVPDDFEARYYLFVSNTVGAKRIGLYAIGVAR